MLGAVVTRSAEDFDAEAREGLLLSALVPAWLIVTFASVRQRYPTLSPQIAMIASVLLGLASLMGFIAPLTALLFGGTLSWLNVPRFLARLWALSLLGTQLGIIIVLPLTAVTSFLMSDRFRALQAGCKALPISARFCLQRGSLQALRVTLWGVRFVAELFVSSSPRATWHQEWANWAAERLDTVDSDLRGLRRHQRQWERIKSHKTNDLSLSLPRSSRQWLLLLCAASGTYVVIVLLLVVLLGAASEDATSRDAVRLGGLSKQVDASLAWVAQHSSSVWVLAPRVHALWPVSVPGPSMALLALQSPVDANSTEMPVPVDDAGLQGDLFEWVAQRLSGVLAATAGWTFSLVHWTVIGPWLLAERTLGTAVAIGFAACVVALPFGARILISRLLLEAHTIELRAIYHAERIIHTLGLPSSVLQVAEAALPHPAVTTALDPGHARSAHSWIRDLIRAREPTVPNPLTAVLAMTTSDLPSFADKVPRQLAAFEASLRSFRERGRLDLAYEGAATYILTLCRAAAQKSVSDRSRRALLMARNHRVGGRKGSRQNVLLFSEFKPRLRERQTDVRRSTLSGHPEPTELHFDGCDAELARADTDVPPPPPVPVFAHNGDDDDDDVDVEDLLQELSPWKQPSSIITTTTTAAAAAAALVPLASADSSDCLFSPLRSSPIPLLPELEEFWESPSLEPEDVASRALDLESLADICHALPSPDTDLPPLLDDVSPVPASPRLEPVFSPTKLLTSPSSSSQLATNVIMAFLLVDDDELRDKNHGKLALQAREEIRQRMRAKSLAAGRASTSPAKELSFHPAGESPTKLGRKSRPPRSRPSVEPSPSEPAPVNRAHRSSSVPSAQLSKFARAVDSSLRKRAQWCSDPDPGLAVLESVDAPAIARAIHHSPTSSLSSWMGRAVLLLAAATALRAVAPGSKARGPLGVTLRVLLVVLVVAMALLIGARATLSALEVSNALAFSTPVVIPTALYPAPPWLVWTVEVSVFASASLFVMQGLEAGRSELVQNSLWVLSLLSDIAQRFVLHRNETTTAEGTTPLMEHVRVVTRTLVVCTVSLAWPAVVTWTGIESSGSNVPFLTKYSIAVPSLISPSIGIAISLSLGASLLVMAVTALQQLLSLIKEECRSSSWL
jgi:hypothetical protein